MASFSELYGVAPPPVDPAAVPPPVYEEPVPAPPPAQEQAPAPPPPTNSFASLYGVEGAPPVQQPQAPPQNFVPGSTYRPPSAEPLPAAPAPQEAPPPASWKVGPVDPQSFEGMNPVERAVRERTPAELQGFIPDVTGFQQQDGWQDKAGYLISGLNAPSDYGTRRTVQRGIDLVNTGDPDTQLGEISPQGIAQHPENVLDILPQLTSNLPGGGQDEFNAWLVAHPEVATEAERSGDLIGAYNQWLNETGQDLESGGVPGLLKGMGRQAGQDVSILPTTAGGLGAGLAANTARLAGQEGLARGILVANDVAQTVIDPLGMAAEVGGKRAIGLLRPSKETEGVIASDIAREAVGANLIERRASGTGAMTPNANLAPAPAAPTPAPAAAATPNVAPTPQPVAQGLPTGPIAMPSGDLLPPAQGAPNMTPNAANLPGQRVIEPTPPWTPSRNMSAPQRPTARPRGTSANGGGSPFTNGRPIDPPNGTPNGKSGGVAPIMRDPARGWVKATGDAITDKDLRIAYRHLEGVDPDDMVEFPMGNAVVPNTSHRNAQYLAAMTEKKWALDDWPSGRKGDIGKEAAGKRWTDLFGKRITQYQEREVNRLVRDFQIELSRDTSPGAVVPSHRRFASYWDNRARSIIEAANKAKYEGSFEIRTPKQTHTYVGKNGAAPKVMTEMVPPVWTGNVMEDGTEAVMQTSLHFSRASERNDVVNRLMDMMDNANAFGDDEASKQFRQRMYKTGAWSQRKASPITAADSAEIVEKKAAQNAAYDRYQAFRAMHEAKHGPSVPATPSLQAGKATPPISGPGRRVDNSFTLDTMAGDADAGLAKSLQDGFRAHLDKMGLGHVQLQFTDYVEAVDENGVFQQAPAFGQFIGKTDNMDLAISYTMDEVLREARQSFGEDGLRVLAETGELENSVKRALYQTLNHESLHGFRRAGVIKDDEWKALVNEANRRGYGKWARENYGPDPNTGQMVYERYYSDPLDRMMSGNADYDEEAVAEMFGDFALNKAQLSPQTRNVFQRMVDLVKGLLDVVVRNDGERVMNDLLSGKIGSRTPSVAPVNPWSGNTRYLQRQKRWSRTALGGMPVVADEIESSWLGRLLTEPQKAVLRSKMPWKGTDQSLFTISNEIADDADYLRFLAQQNQKTGLSGQMQKDFDRLSQQFDLSKRIDGFEQRFDWSDMPDDEVDRIATALFMDEWQKAKLPNMTPKQKATMFGAIMQLNSDINGLRRSVGMSNPIGAARQIFVQTFGNIATFSIAKPSAITGMFKPGEYVKAFRAGQSDEVLSPARQFLRDFGFPDNAQIDTGTKTMAKNATGIKNPLLKGAANILAPKWSRNLVAAPDDVARNSIFRSAMIPGMKREQAALPKRGVEVWKAYDAKWKGQMPAIAPQEIEKTIQTTLKAKTKRLDPFSRATGADIEKAIMADFGSRAGAGTPQYKRLQDFANRVGRDWNSARNTNLQLATKEVQRVAFTWDNTKLDDFVGNFALYHYWASRATGLYVKEFAKNPWKLAALAGMAEQLQQDAERNNYPVWLKGMTRLTNSPAGMVLLASPLDLFGAMGVFDEWQLQGRDPLKDDGRDDGWFGHVQGIVPLFFGPVVQYGAYLTGGMGGEARAPGSLIGIEGSWKKVADIINAANIGGNLPAGMLRDENDMPILLDHNAIQNAVQGFSNRVFGTPMVDLDAGFKANHIFNLQSVLRDAHPEWQTDPDGENKMTRLVNEMKVKADMGEYTPEWLEAEQMTLDLNMTGPDYPGLPEPLKYALRLVSPIRMTGLPEERTTTMYGFGRPEAPTKTNPETGGQIAVTNPLGSRDTYDLTMDKKGSPYDTLDMALLNAANEDYLDFGSDSGIKDAASTYAAIGNGNIATNFQIGDFTYTPQQLSLMSKGEKWDIAEKYLNSKGFTREDYDQYKADKEAIKDAHPDLQGYQAYRDYVNNYAQGPQAFVDQAVRTSPSFARFMSNLPYAPGTEDYYKAALWTDAYYAIEGRQGSVYDPLTLPDRGTIPGMAYGQTFAQNAALQEAVDAAAASSSGGGDGTSFDDFVADVDKKVTNLYYAKKLLDENYPGTGLLPGRDYLDKPLYNAMKEIWEANGVDVPEKNDIALEYYDWLAANATAPDHSVKAFINQRESSGGGSAEDLAPPAPSDVASQLGVTLVESNAPQLAPNGQIDTSKMQRATPAMPVEMRTGPSLGNPVNVSSLPPGLPLFVADIEGDWAEVVAPGGATGWVPTAALLKAA